MNRETAIGQLRHAYSHLAAGTVKDQKGFATGLLGPAIAALEAPDPLRAFVEQMARMTTPEDEFAALVEEHGMDDDGGVEVDGVTIAGPEDWVSEISDDRLLDEYAALSQMIRKARKLLA